VPKWRDRYAAAGKAGLTDRSSRPHHSPTRLSLAAEQQIEAPRRQRLTGPAIARQLGRAVSTVGVVLRRQGLGRLAALTPRPPVIRYQRDRPGELSHIAIDDALRLACTELLADERKDSAIAFTTRAIDWFAGHGVTVERIMTDNGSADKSFAFRDLLAGRSIRHKRTRPYTPRTNGKTERFIQTSLREWTYAQPFHGSAERAAAMRPWISDDNANRPHAALGGKSPLSRIIGLPMPATTMPPDTADPEPGFVGVAGVKPRAATAAGGPGLTPDITTPARSAIGGDNLVGNDR
jgi:transposase InsO family protein